MKVKMAKEKLSPTRNSYECVYLARNFQQKRQCAIIIIITYSTLTYPTVASLEQPLLQKPYTN